MTTNQCDGCARGLPLTIGGDHYEYDNASSASDYLLFRPCTAHLTDQRSEAMPRFNYPWLIERTKDNNIQYLSHWSPADEPVFTTDPWRAIQHSAKEDAKGTIQQINLFIEWKDLVPTLRVVQHLFEYPHQRSEAAAGRQANLREAEPSADPAPSQSSDHPETDAAMFMVHDIDRMAVDIDFARSLELRLRAAERELGECRSDAERYRWLWAQTVDTFLGKGRVIHIAGVRASRDGINAAIDAALNAQKGRQDEGEQHG